MSGENVYERYRRIMYARIAANDAFWGGLKAEGVDWNLLTNPVTERSFERRVLGVADAREDDEEAPSEADYVRHKALYVMKNPKRRSDDDAATLLSPRLQMLYARMKAARGDDDQADEQDDDE